MLLELLVTEVDAELLKRIALENLKPKDIEDADEAAALPFVALHLCDTAEEMCTGMERVKL